MDNIRILCGDAETVLWSLPKKSVHCCVTSPPYFGLRNYGMVGQIGANESLSNYIDRLILVFRAVARVLRPEGTFWLNLGDSFTSGNRKGHGTRIGYKQQTNRGMNGASDPDRPPTPDGLKEKDLMGVPWRLAFALQDDGWYLRSDVIWSKPNPMPESVTDRPTKSHEYLFLLTRQPHYFYDYYAVREEGVCPAGTRGAKGSAARAQELGVNARPPEYKIYDGKRNRRSVWTINARPFKGAHFATFPPALVIPCLKAGTSEHGACEACGAPWTRILQRTPMKIRRSGRGDALGKYGKTAASGTMEAPAQIESVGWQPSCRCEAGVVPCTVLDPFAGSGTVGSVAAELSRRAILIDLNPEYCAMAKERCGLFAL